MKTSTFLNDKNDMKGNYQFIKYFFSYADFIEIYVPSCT